MPNRNLPWTPWHKVVRLRDDVRTGELSLNDFAADLHDVMMQAGKRPIYENPARFFALTFPTLSLRELAKDVMLRLAGKNTKAVRQLELTYGGGKTHTLVTLRHLAHEPEALPSLPAVEQFKSHAGIAPPAARVAALSFDKLDVEKGMEVRGPQGELPLAEASVERARLSRSQAPTGSGPCTPINRTTSASTPPAEPLLVDVLSRPQAEDRGSLVLIDEVLMFARGKVALNPAWGGHLVDFFQHLCTAVTKVDRCALVASLLASDLNKNDEIGQALAARDTRHLQPAERGRRPTGPERRRGGSAPATLLHARVDAKPEIFRPHVAKAVSNLIGTSDSGRKERGTDRTAGGAHVPVPPRPDRPVLGALDATAPLPAHTGDPPDVRDRPAGRRSMGHGRTGRAERVPDGSREGRDRGSRTGAGERRHAGAEREPRTRLVLHPRRRARQGTNHPGRTRFPERAGKSNRRSAPCS